MKREEKQDGKLDLFTKHQNFLKHLRTSLIIVHRCKQADSSLFKNRALISLATVITIIINKYKNLKRE